MKEICFIPIHHKVIVTYVLNRAEPEVPQDAMGWRGDWNAYVLIVKEDETQEEAAHSGRSGNKMPYAWAKAIFGAVVEQWEERGYKYRG
jgi:hypothetical protein